MVNALLCTKDVAVGCFEMMISNEGKFQAIFRCYYLLKRAFEDEI